MPSLGKVTHALVRAPDEPSAPRGCCGRRVPTPFRKSKVHVRSPQLGPGQPERGRELRLCLQPVWRRVSYLTRAELWGALGWMVTPGSLRSWVQIPPGSCKQMTEHL